MSRLKTGALVAVNRLACPDWEDRIRAGLPLIPDAARDINPELRKQAIEIYNTLRLPDVVGQPLLGEASGEWFRDIVGTFLGGVDPTTGHRLIRELFALAPKKSSKTSYGAGMMMTALLMNERPRAEFLLIGPTKLIADTAFSQAAGMVAADRSGWLQKRFAVMDHLKTIYDRKLKSKLLIKSFSPKVLTGVKPIGTLIDELHEISLNSRASEIVGQLRGGMLPFPEAFLAFITTQSNDIPAGVFEAELKTARAIRDGTAMGKMLPVLYEFPKAILQDKSNPPAWQDPKNWAMVTPNNNLSVTIDRLVEDWETAQTKGLDEIKRWASQHLNIEIGQGIRDDHWAGAEFWEAVGDEGLTLDIIIARSDMIVVGIDGGGADDLLGFAVIGRDKRTKEWLHWGHAWAHKSVFTRRKDVAERLRGFARDGDLTIVERVGDDLVQVGDIVERLFDSGLLPEKVAVGVDPIGIDGIVEELYGRGLSVEQVFSIPQGYRLNGAMASVERRLMGCTMKHGASPLMAWCIGNAKIELRGNATAITKQISGKSKIDPVVALLNASRAMAMNPDFGPSVYEDRGLRIA